MKIRSSITVPIEADVSETMINGRRVLAVGALRIPENWLYSGIPAPVVSGTYMHTEGTKAIVSDAAAYFTEMAATPDPFAYAATDTLAPARSFTPEAAE